MSIETRMFSILLEIATKIEKNPSLNKLNFVGFANFLALKWQRLINSIIMEKVDQKTQNEVPHQYSFLSDGILKNVINSDWISVTFWVSVIVVIGLAIYLLRNLQEKSSRSDVDNWIEQNLAKVLAEKLGKPTEDVLQVLRDSLDNEITSMISNLVDSVSLAFTKSSVRDVKIHLDVNYKNGTSFSANTRWDWDRLPETIRNEFIRSGSNIVKRPWQFPWEQM